MVNVTIDGKTDLRSEESTTIMEAAARMRHPDPQLCAILKGINEIARLPRLRGGAGGKGPADHLLQQRGGTEGMVIYTNSPEGPEATGERSWSCSCPSTISRCATCHEERELPACRRSPTI